VFVSEHTVPNDPYPFADIDAELRSYTIRQVEDEHGDLLPGAAQFMFRWLDEHVSTNWLDQQAIAHMVTAAVHADHELTDDELRAAVPPDLCELMRVEAEVELSMLTRDEMLQRHMDTVMYDAFFDVLVAHDLM
jgi:hypothetical protein